MSERESNNSVEDTTGADPDSGSEMATEEKNLPAILEKVCHMSEQTSDTGDENKRDIEKDKEVLNVVKLSPKDMVKQEEDKLKAKFPMGNRPMSGHSAFLQRRLASRQKYFDSGDYQMAKQKPSSVPRPILVPGIECVTGDAIPTPESVPVRKTSIIQPTHFAQPTKFASSPGAESGSPTRLSN